LNSPVVAFDRRTPLGLTFDDRYLENFALPFTFSFFGQLYNTVTISTNGNLYFSTPPKRINGDADDVPGSTADLSLNKMIAGMWDDLDLRTEPSDGRLTCTSCSRARAASSFVGRACNSATAPREIKSILKSSLRSDGNIITPLRIG
jgi:hypothetical protein